MKILFEFGGTDNASVLHSEPVDTAFSDTVVPEKVRASIDVAIRNMAKRVSILKL